MLLPAVIRNTDGKDGTEIDEEIFENAVDFQGLEELVGVEVQGNRRGWKFWT